jgi:hypothetical protein
MGHAELSLSHRRIWNGNRAGTLANLGTLKPLRRDSGIYCKQEGSAIYKVCRNLCRDAMARRPGVSPKGSIDLGLGGVLRVSTLFFVQKAAAALTGNGARH